MAHTRTLSDAYMVVSDLCNSTSIGWRDHERGLRFHKRHEGLCLTASELAADSRRLETESWWSSRMLLAYVVLL
jgi:hypothetical protein